MWIVSDIDGTLLDDSETTPLASALLAAARAQHQIVLASSRTISEIAQVAHRLGLPATPCIAEDGQVIGVADGERELLGTPLQHLFALLDAAGIGREVELLQQTHGAEREASILVPASDAGALMQPVTEAGLRITLGGRWATITGAGWNKGRAARHLLDRHRVREWAAIGNAANDAELLREATHRFVIRNADGGHDSSLADIPDVTLLQSLGPLGWAEMLERHLTTPTLTPEPEGANAEQPSLDRHGPHDPEP